MMDVPDGSIPIAALEPSTIAEMQYGDLTARKEEVVARLNVISVDEVKISSKKAKRPRNEQPEVKLVPYDAKTDTHWDFVMKEMMWLAADFQSERKRQMSLGKKVSLAVKQFHKTKESRRVRELAEAELKRRRLAGKIGRELKGWWTKIERVIAYRQKLDADVERRKAMNKQLVALVKQTERYGESLTRQHGSSGDDSASDNDDEDADENSESSMIDTDDNHLSRGQRRQRRTHRLTIEEALSTGDELNRRVRNRLTDYSRLDQQEKYADEFYGETITSDSGSDDSFVLDSDPDDDETTLLEAEATERIERQQQNALASSDKHDSSYISDNDELRKLQEEGDMDINDVLERLRQEAQMSADMDIDSIDSADERSAKRVTFASDLNSLDKAEASIDANGDSAETDTKSHNGIRHLSARNASKSATKTDPGSDADDDGDASDVEDFLHHDENSTDGSEEFEANEQEVDDETTIAAEERLGRDMSADDEIKLLQREGEMSMDELRSMYARMDEESIDMQADAGDGSEEPDEPLQELDPSESKDLDKLPVISDEPEGSIEQLLEEDDASDEDEFQPPLSGEHDDETTIEAEERLGREMSHEQEISLLQQESEIPIEQLRALYAEASALNDASNSDEEDGSNISTHENGSLSQQPPSLGSNDSDAEDFSPDDTPAVDDETTIEAEERLGRDMSYDEELELLKRESEMSVEDLRQMYVPLDERLNGFETESKFKSTLNESMFEGDDFGEEDEFRPDDDAVDDETTLEAEEKLAREMSVDEEISLLKRESETPIEVLRAMYTNKLAEDDDSSSPESEQVDKTVDSDNDRKRQRLSSSLGDTDEDEGLAALHALQASEERARTTLASRPFLLSSWVMLREYQQIGLNWLVSIQSRRLNGILADEMGLGKTLQTISLLGYLAAYKGIWGPHLIIVPTSCIVNWETEFKRFCPALKVLCYYGSAKRRKELRTGWTKTNWHHVIVTSYQLAVQDSFAFKRKKWYYLILDEAHNIKNFESQRWQTLINFNTQRRLLLTGTPLQNNLMELWSLLHFLMPHVFRSRKEFSYWFSNPMNNIIEGNSSRSDDLISRLHGIIRPFVLRRLKKDVETQMPGKFEHLVKCQLSRRQMFLYEEFMARSSTRQALRKGGNFMGMMNVLMQLRKVCNHPDLFEPRSVITPLSMDSLHFVTAGCVVEATRVESFLKTTSQALLSPIWCGASGDVCSDVWTDHDDVKAEQLSRLQSKSSTFLDSLVDYDNQEPRPTKDMNQAISSLLNRIRHSAQETKRVTWAFQSNLNSRRCQSPAFPYPRRLVRALEMATLPLDRAFSETLSGSKIISTPTELLAMRKSQQQRADELDDTIKKFVFCVPKAGAQPPELDASVRSIPSQSIEKDINAMLLEPMEEYFRPFRTTHARLSSFFPDKKLIQFDAGKLQTLARLLHELKRGGHRALIFTQMSKMLDLLEAFLNLNGHTYLRLDGSTGVDRRQRLMDRFNNDPKVFCFILSTRSGGLGINLTGADTVIFYDSDWNPAMDAQAQDRAHRIGQTRDVHIYRLITEHSIEENILAKAQQKRNLDLLVMDEGKFDVARPNSSEKSTASEDIGDVYTKGGLRNILGIGDDQERWDDLDMNGEGKHDEPDVTKEQMERAMASLEDEDDVLAMRGAQKEAADELQEFDETIELTNDTEGDDDEGEADDAETPDTSKPRLESEVQTSLANNNSDEGDARKSEEVEMEQEFAAWQDKVGMDASAIEASLAPTERYALQFREKIDPFYSIFYIMEYRRKMEAAELEEDKIDIDELERTKAVEEERAIDEGDLLGTNPEPEELIRQQNLYVREKARLRSNKKKRRLTGENWEARVDGVTQFPFWYNTDTGEAVWDRPQVLIELEAEELAHDKKWNAIPIKPLVKIMAYLIPFPERMHCAAVCRQWRAAASDISFVRHVLPVEMGALAKDVYHKDNNHFQTIAEALALALPGDTIELSDGHYWVNEPGLSVNIPVQIVGDENDPSHVIIELSGTVRWSGTKGRMEGVTFRRPRIAKGELLSSEILHVTAGGSVDMVHCVLDNDGSKGVVARVTGPKSKGRWRSTELKGSASASGVMIESEGQVHLTKCIIMNNAGPGVVCNDNSSFTMTSCRVEGNAGGGVQLRNNSRGQILKCRFSRNNYVIIDKEQGCICTPCSGNTANLSSTSTQKHLPGFRLLKEGEEIHSSYKDLNDVVPSQIKSMG